MYNEIIDEIKSNLTGNKEKDKEFLKSQMVKYADSDYGQEIVLEIGRLMWDFLSDEEKSEFIKISDNENPIKDAFMEAKHYIDLHDLKTALNILDSFFKIFPFGFNDDKINEYHSFSNPIEEILFNEYIKTNKELRFIPPNQPYVELYYLYGFLLIEFSRFDEAENILDHAIKLNPVNSQILLERAEIFKFKEKWVSFLDYSQKALNVAYSSADLARSYRNLGFYYIESEDFELATALFNYSLSIEYSGTAFSELEYIKQLGHKNTIGESRMMELLESNNIQIGPNPIIFSILSQLIIEADLNKNNNALSYFYEIYYDLTGDEEVLKKMNNLP